jgi:hypothetical protein
MKKLLLLVMAVGLTNGCATNWYAKFYTDFRPSSVPVTPLPEGVEPQIVPIEFDTESQAKAVKAYKRKGYNLIGVSGFWAAHATQDQLKKHAREIGADIVLHSSKYLRTQTGVAAIPQYNPGQTYNSNFSGNVGGSNFYGTSTTRSQGSFSNQYVPYSVDTYQYSAGYMAKAKKEFRLGVFFRGLSDEEKSKLETNKGLVIDVVVDGTPAFKADLLEGDIITAIGDKEFSDYQSFGGVISGFPAGSTPFHIIRKGKKKTIEVQLK